MSESTNMHSLQNPLHELKPCYTTVKTTPLASNRVSY